MKKTGPSIQTRVPVSEVLRLLRGEGVNLGYTGLMYYRSLGLISPPEKEKGSKERFYDVFKLQERIIAIKLISSIFGLNYQELASYAKRLPSDTFNKLPLAFMKIYVDVQVEFDKMTAGKKTVNPSGPFDLWIFEGIKKAFLKVVEETIKMAQSMNTEEYYMKMVKQEILARKFEFVKYRTIMRDSHRSNKKVK